MPCLSKPRRGGVCGSRARPSDRRPRGAALRALAEPLFEFFDAPAEPLELRARTAQFLALALPVGSHLVEPPPLELHRPPLRGLLGFDGAARVLDLFFRAVARA